MHQLKVVDAKTEGRLREGTRRRFLESRLDLDLIYEKTAPGLFEKQGVKRGTAKRFVLEI